MLKKVLRVSLFDIDDNLFATNSKIYLEDVVTCERKAFSTAEFAKLGDLDTAGYCMFDGSLREFRDNVDSEIFFNEAIATLSESALSPSWDAFRESLLNAEIIGFVTARGHSKFVFKAVVKCIINNQLVGDAGFDLDEQAEFVGNVTKLYPDNESVHHAIEEYLNDCSFHGMFSPEFENEYPEHMTSSGSVRKAVILEQCHTKYAALAEKFGMHLTLGFSDDDESNVQAALELFRNLAGTCTTKFCVFNSAAGEKYVIT